MPEKETVNHGTGIVQKKEERMTKAGKPFWSFTINNAQFSMFEHSAGLGINLGDNVDMYWTTNEKGYNNLNSIVSIDDVAKPRLVPQNQPVPQKDMKSVVDYKYDEANKFAFGMACNNAAIFSSKILEKAATAEAIINWLKDNGDYYDSLVKALYQRELKLRKEILGY